MTKLLFALTLSSALLLPASSFAQHPDESQMLRKPGEAPVASKVQPAANSNSNLSSEEQYKKKYAVSPEVIMASPAAADIPADNNEPGKEYLQEGIILLRQGESLNALRELNKACREGNHEAQYRVAVILRDGLGVKASPEDAAYWFRKAASNGHVQSQFEIGRCFLEGIGVLPDKRVAAEFFWRAAENNHPMAALYVARMYRDGDGMEKNLKRAQKYMTVAAEAGLDGAAEELQEINMLIKTAPAEKKNK